MADIDVSNIADVSHLFKNTKRENFSGMEKLDISNVTDMSWMFAGVTSFNQPLASWDVGKVEKMRKIFKGSAQNPLP